MSYIETGYENELLDTLKDKNLKCVFINGEFGSGKTMALENALSTEGKLGNSKILKIKIYEEFVEENYFSFMYNILKEKEIEECNSLMKFLKFHSEKILIPLLSSIPIISFTVFTAIVTHFNIVNKLRDNLSILSIVLVILVLCFSILTYNFASYTLYDKKINQKLYIIKQIKNLAKNLDNNSSLYIIIDDLDRVYIEQKEILKLIQFLHHEILEGSNNIKLLLLGDKSNFIEQNLDVLEKYYDILFEIPKVLTRLKISELIQEHIQKIYAVKNEHDLALLNNIWRDTTARRLSKVLTHLKKEEHSPRNQIVKRLYMYDYLFMLTLYYSNKTDLQTIIDIIHTLKENTSFSKSNYSIPGNKNSGDRQLEAERAQFQVINSIDLPNSYKKYIKSCYNYYCSRKTHYDPNNKIHTMFDYYEKKIYTHRLFDQPSAYDINSFLGDELYPTFIQENFEQWILNGDERFNLTNFQIYCEESTADVGFKKFMNYFELGYFSPFRYSIDWIIEYLGLHTSINEDGEFILDSTELSISNPNINYFYKNHIGWGKKSWSSNDSFYTEISEYYGDNYEKWQPLNKYAKYDILHRECDTECHIFREFVIKDGDEACYEIIELMLTMDIPYYFNDFFSDNLIDFEKSRSKINEIIHSLTNHYEKCKCDRLAFSNTNCNDYLEKIKNIKNNYKNIM